MKVIRIGATTLQMEKLAHKGLKPPDKGSIQQHPHIDLISQKYHRSIPYLIVSQKKHLFFCLQNLLIENTPQVK